MTAEAKTRLTKTLKKTALILIIGLAYYVFTKLTGWGIPCLLYKLTGNYCPGCGISRMCIALLELDLARAFRSNALVLILLPFALIFGLRRLLIYVRTGKTDPDRPETVFLIVTFSLTVTFWILRNLPAFSFLAPQ